VEGWLEIWGFVLSSEPVIALIGQQMAEIQAAREYIPTMS
jgi:hypothetical protein